MMISQSVASVFRAWINRDFHPLLEKIDEISCVSKQIISSKKNILVTATCLLQKALQKEDVLTPLGYTDVKIALVLFPFVKNGPKLEKALLEMNDQSDLKVVKNLIFVLHQQGYKEWLGLLKKIDLHQHKLFTTVCNNVLAYTDPVSLEISNWIASNLIKEKIDISVIFDLNLPPINFFKSIFSLYQDEAFGLVSQLHALGYFDRVAAEHLLMSASECNRLDVLEAFFLNSTDCTDLFETISHININLVFYETIQEKNTEKLRLLLTIFPKQRIRQLNAFFSTHLIEHTAENAQQLFEMDICFHNKKELKTFLEKYPRKPQAQQNALLLMELISRQSE